MNKHINLNLKHIWLFCLMAFAVVVSPKAYADEDQFTNFDKYLVDNIKWMKKNLNLTTEQMNKIDLIQTNVMSEAGALRKNTTKDHATKLNEYAQLRSDFNNEMKTVLTPDQWEKYEMHLKGLKDKEIEKMEPH